MWDHQLSARVQIYSKRWRILLLLNTRCEYSGISGLNLGTHHNSNCRKVEDILSPSISRLRLKLIFFFSFTPSCPLLNHHVLLFPIYQNVCAQIHLKLYYGLIKSFIKSSFNQNYRLCWDYSHVIEIHFHYLSTYQYCIFYKSKFQIYLENLLW